MNRARVGETRAELASMQADARPERIAALQAEVLQLQVLAERFLSDLQRTSLTSPIAGRVLAEIPNSDGLLKTHLSGFAKIDAGTRLLWYVLARPLVRWAGVIGWYLVP